MVKGYDPTLTDPAALFLNSFFHFFNSTHTITLDQSQKYVSYWLKHSEHTSKIYSSFRQMQMKPKIRLIKKCKLPQKSFRDEADVNFPSNSSSNEITLCLNSVRNKVELKEHLDRQMTLMHLQNSYQKSQDEEEREKTLMRNIYHSCHSGYRNYLLDQKVTKELAVNCTKYLFFRKSRKSLPMDRLFRYTSQMLEQFL